MEKIKKVFTEHPASVNESYIEHLFFAFSAGLWMVYAGISCCIHSIFPFILIRNGSDCINGLTARMEKRKTTLEVAEYFI